MKNIQLIGAGIGVILAGCSSKGLVKQDEVNSFINDKPAALRPYFASLYQEGNRNAVLNFDRLGLAAMENGNDTIAAKAFDQAIQRIDAIYSDNPDAEKARSLWNSEKVKDFKGEPYERAMAYYYRGLLYLKEGDYDNARASFLGANRQDQYAEDQKYQSDFGLMDYLAGWTSSCQGDKASAEDRFGKLSKQHPSHLAQLTEQPPKFLAIVEVGDAPVKTLQGRYNEKLTFRDSANMATPSVQALNKGKPEATPAINAADTYYQATTRGGRAIDGINEGKAEFKKTNEDIAATTSTLSTMATLNSYSYTGNAQMAMGALGIASALISIGTRIAAEATTPEADARSWESIPRNVFLYGTNESLGSNDLSFVSSKTKGGSVTATPKLSGVHGQCGFAWARIDSALAKPPVVNTISEDGDSDHLAKNQAFRAELKRLFSAGG